MRKEDKDFLALQALRRALATMQLIHAGEIQIADSGYVINLSSDIRQLERAVAVLEFGNTTTQ